MRIFPTRDEFRSLAQHHTIVPVWTEMLADLETPVAAYMKLVGDKPGFLLESVENGERWGRYSFVGRHPLATMSLSGGHILTTGNIPDDVPRDRGILAAMERLLNIYKAPLFTDLPPLQSGLVGYMGYDVVREIEQLGITPFDDR